MPIFSYKIKFLDGDKAVASGRLKGESIQDVTQQLVDTVINERATNTNVHMLKNQELALKQWHKNLEKLSSK